MFENDGVETSDQQPATASAPTVTSDQLLDNQIALIKQRRNDALNAQIQQSIFAAGTDPNRAGEAQRLGYQIGTSPEIAERNVDLYRKISVAKRIQDMSLAETSPILARQMTDPHFATLGQDDLDNLTTGEKIFRAVSEAPSQWEAGQLQHERALLGYQASMGAATDADYARIDAIDKQLAEIGPSKTWLGGAANMAGNLKTYGLGSVTAGAFTGLITGTLTAAAGALGAPETAGASLGLEAAVPEAAMAGFKFGASWFGAQDMLRSSAGEQYLAMRKRGVDHGTAAVTSTVTGLLNTALMSGGMGKVLEPYAGELSRMIGSGVEGAMTRPTLARGLAAVAGSFALHSAEGGATMASQEIVNQIGMDVARSIQSRGLESDLATPEGRQDFAGRVVDSFLTGGLMSAAVSAPGVLLELHGRAARAAEAQRSAAFFEALSKNASESKVRQRNPDAHESYISAAARGGPADKLYVNGDALNALLFQNGVAPEKLDEAIPGTSAKISEAVATGGDVEIPTAAYAARLAGTPLGDAMKEHLKLNPEAMSPFEAKRDVEARQQWAADGGPQRLVADMQATDAETRATPEWQEVKDRLTKQYIDAGEKNAYAEAKATLDANVYANLAKQSGMKPTELLEMYSPKIVAGEAPVEQPAAQPSDALFQPRRASKKQNLEAARIQGEMLKGDGSEPAAETPATDQPRGYFRRKADGTLEIGKTPAGDASTWFHEAAHSYLRMMSDLAARPEASERLKGDYQKVLDWLGAKDFNSLTREQHEQWARANEKYLREGVAPSKALQPTFRRIGQWLQKVYRKASDLGVEFPKEISGVMDRIYASEQGVDRAEAEAGPRQFNSPEEAGWTEEEFRNYAQTRDISVDQAKAEILAKLNEAAQREHTEAWRKEKHEALESVTRGVDSRPDYTAIRSLRRGALDDGTQLTLSREALAEQFGEDRVKALNKAHPGLYRNEGGADPETAAELLGFRSADEMLRAIEATPKRGAAIDQALRAYLTNQHGDIRYDGTLDDKARVALENDQKARSLHQELAALRRRVQILEKRAADNKAAMAAITIAPLESYQEAARQMIAQKPISDIQPYRYLISSRKFSRDAFDAARSGKAAQAADAKHKELLNHFLFREAMEAKDYVGKFEKSVKQSVQSKGIQQRLGLAGSDFRDQHNWLLARYGLGPSPEQGQYAQPGRPLRDWAAERYAAAEEPAIAPGIMDDSRYKNYRNVPLSEIRDLHDALVNIRALARQQFELFVQGKRVEFGEAKKSMIDAAQSNLKVKPEPIFEEDRTRGEKAAGLVQRGDAMLMRMERMIEWLDGGKTGPWHDHLWNLAADAQGDEYALQHDITAKLHEAVEMMPKEWRDGLTTDRVAVDGITVPITRKRLISMALNMGNDGNLDRLRKTFIHYNWDPAGIEGVKQALTRQDWQFVQHTWDMLVPLGERMKDLEKRLTGLPPVMVEVTPLRLQLADGPLDLRGGYYPIKMDPKFSQRAIMAEAGETAQNAMDHGYVRATTSRGYTKARTGFGGPLLLDFENVLSDHTAKVVKDLTHREFMLAANRLLTDTEIRKALRETLGPAYEAQMMPWLRTIINDRNGSTGQGLSDFSTMMGTLRGNLTTATLGFKVTTSLLQITHAPRMMLYTKPGSWAQSMMQFLANPKEMTREIKELSPNEMRFRGDSLDRDIREKLSELSDSSKMSRIFARAANITMQYIDHLLSFPLWHAVYQDALKEHAALSEADARYQAIHQADSAVRLGLGSQAPKDLPAIMRQNDLTKLLTMFYGFHNGIYGQVRDVAHQFRYDRNVGKLTFGLTLSVLAPAVLSQMIMGKGPQDDENSGLWAAKRAALFGMDTIPLLRDLAGALDRDGDVRFSPLEEVMSKAGKAAIQAGSNSEGKDWTGIGLNALESVMDVSGVPGTTQGMRLARYAHHVQQGKIEDPNAWDAIVGGGVKR